MDVDKLVGEMYNEMLKRCGIMNRFTPGDLDIPEEDEYEETGIEYDPDVYKSKPELGKGVKFERIRRITGYLVGDVNRWNNGKKAELKDRSRHEL
jgi:hypothetical protein